MQRCNVTIGLSKSEGSNSKNKSPLLEDLDKETTNQSISKNGNTITNGKQETEQKKKKNLFSSLFEKKKMEMDTRNIGSNKDDDNDYIVKKEKTKEIKTEKNIEIEKEMKNGKQKYIVFNTIYFFLNNR